MARPSAVPPVVARALRPAHPKCYRHCERETLPHTVRTALPGELRVFACPGGVVSVASYTEWSDRDPQSRLLRELRRRALPPSLVRRWDLRAASRHGPELGRTAERFLERARPVRPIRVVYWRVYPFEVRKVQHRLFACFRHGTGSVVFYAAPFDAAPGECPRCRTGSSRLRRR